MRNEFQTSFYPSYHSWNRENEREITNVRILPGHPGYVKSLSTSAVVKFDSIEDLISKGKKLYYARYEDCRTHIHGRDYTDYSGLYFARSQKEVREHIASRNIRHGSSDGRVVNCIIEVCKMHPYQVAQMLNAKIVGERYDEQQYFNDYYEWKYIRR